MGQVLDLVPAIGVGDGNNREEEPPVFVIPFSTNLTLNQVTTLTLSGQQPGVPFKLVESTDGQGAQRPRGVQAKINISRKLVSLKAESIKLIADDFKKAFCKLTFNYDAKEDGFGIVFVGGRDYRTSGSIRVDNARTVIGPFALPKGENCEWVYESSAQHIHVTDMPALGSREYSSSRHHDIIIVVSANMLPEAVYGPAMIYSSSGRTISENKKRYAWSYGEISLESTRENNNRMNKFSKFVAAEMTNLRVPSISADRMVAFRGQTGVVPSSSSSAKTVDPISLACVDQVVLFRNVVFTISGIYGLAHSTAKESQQANNDEENDVPVGESEDKTPALELNTDSEECVICLTDPRSVVVYPCRHACMCIGCAQALPAQNNKCPICRRPAKMMIVLPTANTSE